MATPYGDARLYRGVVTALDLGWRGARLPLGPTKDLEADGFPVEVTLPGSLDDALAPAAPLVLYRALWEDGSAATRTLRLVKSPAGLGVSL